MLANSNVRPIVQFVPISSDLPLLTSDLSSDQKYLLNICQAISTGECNVSLANRHPGNISHSRWLTTANNILRSYISTINPSNELVVLTNYIVKVYAPCWFQIKLNSKCTDGAKNLWQLANRSRYLQNDLKNIVDSSIQRNGFFGHPENILLAMLGDSVCSIRQLAVNRIIDARKNRNSVIRVFKVGYLY